MDDNRVALITCLMLAMFATVGSAEMPEPEPSRQKDLVAAAREIIGAAPLAALVTLGADGSPSVRMMDALAPDESMVIRLGTNSRSRKVKEIRENPNVAIYYTDYEGPGYVTIKGKARIVDDAEETSRHWQERWSQFYLPDRSNYLLIEVLPDTIEVVSYRHGIVSESESWKVPAMKMK